MGTCPTPPAACEVCSPLEECSVGLAVGADTVRAAPEVAVDVAIGVEVGVLVAIVVSVVVLEGTT